MTLTAFVRGAAIVACVGALSWLAMRVDASHIRSFDGSVAVHNVGNIPLVDDRGGTFVMNALPRGAIVILGYTRCTDECPLTLSHVASALAPIPALDRPAAFFVTVDPGYDTPATLRAYLNHWHPRITGVTGQRLHLERFYAALGSTDPGSRYRDHDTRIFLLNTDGDVAEELSPDAGAENIQRSISSR